MTGFRLERAQTMYQFYQDWTSGKLPRMLLLIIQHANPYYDDSYAVDSANVGPYGEAINRELIPYIEKKFRGIGEGWARAVYGGSTGGWETLATANLLSRRFQRRLGRLPRSQSISTPISLVTFTTMKTLSGPSARAEKSPNARCARLPA